MLYLYDRENSSISTNSAELAEAYTFRLAGDDIFCGFVSVLTRIPSQRDTARNGRNARNVRIERNAGISAAPNQIAPKFINDNFNYNTTTK